MATVPHRMPGRCRGTSRDTDCTLVSVSKKLQYATRELIREGELLQKQARCILLGLYCKRSMRESIHCTSKTKGS